MKPNRATVWARSLIIAGLGTSAGVEPRLAPLAAAYVLLLAVGGPIVARFAEPIADVVQSRVERAAQRHQSSEELEDDVAELAETVEA